MRRNSSGLNRRTWLQASSALAAGSALTGCGGKPVLKVFNWSLYIDDKLIEEFQEETGCRIVYDNFSGDAELEARLAGGGGAYDVVFPSDRAMQALLPKGLLQPLDHSRLKN